MEILLVIFFAILGAILASFTGVIAERANTGQSWSKGRSRCNSCRRDLAVIDLAPVVSWVVFRGRCRTCRSRIPATYTLFELALAVLFAWAYLSVGLLPALVPFLALLVILGFIVLYDLRHTIVPIGAVVLLLLCAGAYRLLAFGAAQITSAILVAFALGLVFFLLYAFSRGRAMGLGDAPVAFILSLITGPQQALAGFLFSFWIGAAVGIALLVLRRGKTTMKSEIPFVPFLTAGYLLAFFTGWNPLPPLF